MLEVKEEELKKILPSDGPSIDEVKKYLEKYNDEYIVIKCGGSVLVDQNLFNILFLLGLFVVSWFLKFLCFLLQ